MFEDIEDDLWDDASILEKIKYKYWDIWPYDLRPSEIWYKFRCWAWKRYSTIKPRFVGHGWIDRDNLLLHTNFEILCDFVENELRDGYVDWDSDEIHKNVRNELENLYSWWMRAGENYKNNEMYLDSTFNEYYKVLRGFAKNEEDGPVRHISEMCGDMKVYRLEHKLHNEEKWGEYIRAKGALDVLYEQFILSQLLRLFTIRRFMWT